MKNKIYKILEFGTLIKAINGIAELVLALVVLFGSKHAYSAIKLIFSHELATDPNDFIVNYIVNFAANLSLGHRGFIAIYLIIHALINFYLFFIIWGKRFKQFPIVIVILLLLTAYQIFRFYHTESIVLFFITLVDIIVIYLAAQYYKNKFG